MPFDRPHDRRANRSRRSIERSVLSSRRRIRLLAIVAVLGLLAAACSSGDGDSGTSPVANTEDCTPAESPIVTVTAYSNVYDVYGKLISAFQSQWKEEHNDQQVIFQESYGGSTTQSQNVVNGFAADIETRAEGTHLTTHRMKAYIDAVNRVHPEAYMILVPPRPNSYTVRFYPYHLTPRFDAVAPMVYWGSTDPAKATRDAVSYLKRYGRPVAPIGQSFDMGPEGGPKGHPSGRALVHFMNEAQRRGAIGVSFWSWQHTPRGLWHTIDTYRWPARPGRK